MAGNLVALYFSELGAKLAAAGVDAGRLAALADAATTLRAALDSPRGRADGPHRLAEASATPTTASPSIGR